jgi:hypothetical protein
MFPLPSRPWRASSNCRNREWYFPMGWFSGIVLSSRFLVFGRICRQNR